MQASCQANAPISGRIQGLAATIWGQHAGCSQHADCCRVQGQQRCSDQAACCPALLQQCSCQTGG